MASRGSAQRAAGWAGLLGGFGALGLWGLGFRVLGFGFRV